MKTGNFFGAVSELPYLRIPTYVAGWCRPRDGNFVAYRPLVLAGSRPLKFSSFRLIVEAIPKISSINVEDQRHVSEEFPVRSKSGRRSTTANEVKEMENNRNETSSSPCGMDRHKSAFL